MPFQTSSQQRRTTAKNTHQTTLDGQGTDSSRPGTPATTGPTTTAGKRAPPKLTAQEIIALTNEVNDIESGKKYLERTALAIKGKPYTTSTGISLPAITAIRGVAFILEGKTTDETAETIARLVIASISPHVAKLQDTEEAISKITEELNTKGSTQDSQLTKVQASVDKLATQITDSSTLKPSYATALKTGNLSHQDQELQTQISQRLAREAIKERQLLIDFPTNSTLAAGKSSHAQLVERIRKALTNIPKDNNIEFNIKAIMQFKQGGMVIEFGAKEAADHIRTNKESRNTFLKHLDPSATIKERTYPVVIPFMPVTFDPTSKVALKALETENEWMTGTVTSARWIKPAEKRKDTQQVAHVLINLTDPKTANTAIRDGITSNQLKLWPKKNRREPIRCAKCQHYGHIARECISHGDTCANCGNNHRTNDCTTKNKYYCTSCETEDHSSWNRDCPTFKKKCDDTDKRYPENSMPFFPTDEDWTHAAAPPKPAPYRKPPSPPSKQPPNLTQRTLDSFPNRSNQGTRREREHGAEPPARRPYNNHSSPRHSHPPQQPQDFFSNLDFTTATNHNASGWND